MGADNDVDTPKTLSWMMVSLNDALFAPLMRSDSKNPSENPVSL